MSERDAEFIRFVRCLLTSFLVGWGIISIWFALSFPTPSHWSRRTRRFNQGLVIVGGIICIVVGIWI